MDINRAKELLPIIQAYAEGKTIQAQDEGSPWCIVIDPSWLNSVKYRIMPEPRTPYQVYADGCSPQSAPHPNFNYEMLNNGLKAVIEAAKAGEFDGWLAKKS